MKIDIIRQIGAITREVRSHEQDGKPAKVVVATRTFDTGIEDVWDAITSPQRLPRWFLPVTGELRLGGRYQLQGNAGGQITACEPPRRLAVTWEFGGGVSWLTVQLAEDPRGGTRLELEHTAHVEEHWQKFGPGAVGVGWDLTLLGLGLHLAGAMGDAAEGAAWAGTPAGREFMSASSNAWGRAAVASGTPEATALASAAATTAFYTGESCDTPPGEGHTH